MRKRSPQAMRLKAKTPVAADNAAATKYAHPVLVEPFHVAVDQELKSGHGDTVIELPKVAADPQQNLPHRARSASTERGGVTGAES